MPRYIRPASLAEAVQALTLPRPILLAGGTELYRAAFPPDTATVIDLVRLDALRQIDCEESGLSLGALARWSDVLEAGLPEWAAPLREAAEAISAPQIRHAGTLGGNVASPSGERDGAVALLVLDARARVLEPDGSHDLPLSLYLARPRDRVGLLTHILVPAPPAPLRGGFSKLGLRQALGPPIGAVAVSLLCDGAGAIRGARAAVGAPGLNPRRLPDLEDRLCRLAAGADPSQAVDAETVAEPELHDGAQCSVSYRRHVLAVLLRRLLAKLDAKQ